MAQTHARHGFRDPPRLLRGSGGLPGSPVLTAQKPQARVQTSPRIMKVAVPRFQQSPMFGQRASSQTVCRSGVAHEARADAS